MTLVIQPKNLRTLTWAHFQKVRRPKDDTGSHASTGHKISWAGSGKTIQITLKLDTSKTWVIPAKASADLLRHEQGHWDIYVLKAEEMNRKLQTVSAGDLQAEFDSIASKYEEVDQQYDDETRHSEVAAKQEEWNCKLDAAKRNHTLDLAATCAP